MTIDPALITRAKHYLRFERNLTQETINEWKLGLCPDWKVMAPELISAGNHKLAESCGLIRTGNGNTYDYFNHRITIPIHNAQGRIVGFGGRLIPGVAEGGPKYLNSPESPVYPKSKVLYGLHKARTNFARHGGACLVEGYFDTIKLHQRGWDNTVATCGTALTEDQAKLLRRYTDTVFIMRDGDKAGRKAIASDILMLVPQQFKVYVIELPEKEDPDTLFDQYSHEVIKVLEKYQDGIEWLCDHFMSEGVASAEPSLIAEGIDRVVKLLAEITNQVRRDQYVKTVAKRNELKTADLLKPLDKFFQQRKREAEEAEESQDTKEVMPAWVDRKRLEEDGFVQLTEATSGYKPGIYFLGDSYSLVRATNFTINPLYHIFEQNNNRRLMEVNNCVRSAVVEMPSAAMVNQNTFEGELVNKGNFVCDFAFQKKQFKRLVGWLTFKMPITYDLKTLGWQPEGFFAFSNRVFVPGTGAGLIEYDELGVVEIEGKHYISMGNSKIHRDERATDNPYENDLYLKYVRPASPPTFTQWAKDFHETYSDNAPYGIAFSFLTVFKDLATRIAKMPMLYCYGPKGSGKSAMAESMTWLFFSGKNAEGDLIKGYNLNPGQGTPFSFFNRVERFRNCPILFNEFDENNIEDWKFGTFKAAYDGEGREVGDGDTGKKRKTKIQKVQGTVIIVGQYLSIKDDGSVLSRSISCQFSLERLKNLSEQQIAAHQRLKDMEEKGLSALLIELLEKRPEVQKLLPKNFLELQGRLMKETKEAGHRIEARLISNYSLILSAAKTMEGIGITLPFSFADFYRKCLDQVIAHNKLLKDNSAIHQFWKTVEFLFDVGFVQDGRDIKVRYDSSIDIKSGSTVQAQKFQAAKNILIVRFSNLYASYSKRVRETTGKVALPEDTLLLYMKEQPYYIGLAPVIQWSDKRTSGYAFDYDMMQDLGIILERNNQNAPGENTPPPPPPPPAPTQGELDIEPGWVTGK